MKAFAPLDQCPDAAQALKHVQLAAEEDRSCLSKELHDEMGGILVGAIMDVDATKNDADLNATVRGRLARVRSALAQLIAIQRHVVETLRPSMLDNFPRLKRRAARSSFRSADAQTRQYEIERNSWDRYASN
jgi:signal transduction histidine kinase